MNITQGISYTALFISILFVVIGQIFIKKGALNVELNEKRIIRSLVNIISNKDLLLGLFFAFSSPLFYFIALRNIELSVAYAFNSLNYLLVSLVGILFWNEKISKSKIIGLFLIVIGIIIISYGK